MRRTFVGILAAARSVQTAWCIAGVTLVLLIGLELAARSVRSVKRNADRKQMATCSAFEGADWALDYVNVLKTQFKGQWYSYVYWRGAPLRSRYINIGEAGIRKTINFPAQSQNVAANSESPLQIMMFGGSSMWGYGMRDEHTVASELSRELSRRGYDVEVTNFGQLGYVSTQDRLALEEQVHLGREVDVAIFFNGYNDLMAALQEGRGGLPQNEEHRRVEFNINAARALLHDAERSGIAWLLEGLVRRMNRSPDPRSKSKDPSVDELAADTLRAYVTNLREVHLMAESYDFLALFYWQPSAFSKQNLVGTEEGAATVYPTMANLQTKVLERLHEHPLLPENPRFHNCVNMFDETEQAIFLDSCHFNEAAARQIALRMADDLEPMFFPL